MDNEQFKHLKETRDQMFAQWLIEMAHYTDALDKALKSVGDSPPFPTELSEPTSMPRYMWESFPTGVIEQSHGGQSLATG